MTEKERRCAILMAYRAAYDRDPENPFLNAKSELPAKVGAEYEEMAADVAFLEQNRYLHWKAANVFRLSPKGLRVTRTPGELNNEF